MDEDRDGTGTGSQPVAPPAARSRRRTLAFTASVLIAVLVLAVLPALLASRPAYVRNIPALSDEYRRWSVSTHAEASCESCHTPRKRLAKAVYRVRMVSTFYRGLVAGGGRDAFPSPTNDACLACHSDLRSVSPKGDLQIPHRAHVTVLKMQCVECHDYLVHRTSPEGKHTPPMGGCLECHDGDRAEDGCTACHTEKAAPASHRTATWVVEHPRDPRDPECVGCHRWADDWCTDCHADRPRSHTKDWRASHGAAVAKHRSCEACHEGPFCFRCHGELPKLNYDPALKKVQ